MKLTLTLTLISIISLAYGATESLRFVNQVEGATLTIYSNAIETIILPYMSSTNYYPIAGGELMVTNVLDQNGNSLTNGNSILLRFESFCTMALVKTGDTFTFVQLNETVPTDAPMNDVSRAYLRLVNLGNRIEYVTCAVASGAISTYSGFLVATPFKAIDPRTSELRIYDSKTGTYNSPLLTLPTDLQAGKAYTVFFFTPANGVSGHIAYDHDVDGGINVPSSSTTGTNAPVTTGAPSTTTTNAATSGTPSLTTKAILTPVNNNENSAATLFGGFLIIALSCLLL